MAASQLVSADTEIDQAAHNPGPRGQKPDQAIFRTSPRRIRCHAGRQQSNPHPARIQEEQERRRADTNARRAKQIRDDREMAGWRQRVDSSAPKRASAPVVARQRADGGWNEESTP